MFAWDFPSQEVTAPIQPTAEQLAASTAEAEQARNAVRVLNENKAAITAAGSPKSPHKLHDLVFVRRRAVYNKANSKLSRQWIGPCLILKLNPYTAVVQQLPGGFSGTVNFGDVKAFNGPRPPSALHYIKRPLADNTNTSTASDAAASIILLP